MFEHYIKKYKNLIRDPCPVQWTTIIKTYPCPAVTVCSIYRSMAISASGFNIYSSITHWIILTACAKCAVSKVAETYPGSITLHGWETYGCCLIFHVLLIPHRQRNRTRSILLTYMLENINMNEAGNNCVSNAYWIINQPDFAIYIAPLYIALCNQRWWVQCRSQ
jgi:hypothetical protein